MKRALSVMLCTALWSAAQDAPQRGPEPYKDGRKTIAPFEGPGRDLPEPAGITEVLLGYYGPSDAAHPDGGALWQAASLAIEDANREGGYRGRPFRLAAHWSEDPWRAGASIVTRMAFEERVWAVIGSIEGSGTHLAEQVVAKALLPLVNPAATDRSIHEAGVPWMFSVVQGDDQHAAVLARMIAGREVVILSATDHDSRAFLHSLAPHNVKVRLRREFEPGRPDLAPLIRDAVDAHVEVVAVIASARESARVVRLLRESGYKGTITGGPWFGRSAFTAAAGSAAGGAVFPWVGPVSATFAQRFSARYRAQPDYAAACAYDAVRITVAAVRKAGLNRSRIREALAAMPRYEGASGRIEWDEFGQARRAPVAAIIRNGAPTPVRD